MNDYKMTPGERRATWGLGTVFSLRMLGTDESPNDFYQNH